MDWLSKPHGRWKGAGKVIGYLLIILSVPTWPQELRDQLDQWRRNVPLWLFGLFGVALLVLLYGAEWRQRARDKRAEGDRNASGQGRSGGDREGASGAKDAEVARLTKATQDLEQQNTILGAKINWFERELQAAKDNHSTTHREWQKAEENAAEEIASARWFIEYGKPKPRLVPLEDADLRTARTEIAKLSPCLAEVERKLEPLRIRLHNEWTGRGEKSPFFWLAGFVASRVATPVKRSLGLLKEQITQKHDTRAALIVFYDCYNSYRTWISHVAVLDAAILNGGDFREWRAADRQFFEKLKESLAVPELKEVAEAIEQLNDTYAYPTDMPWDL